MDSSFPPNAGYSVRIREIPLSVNSHANQFSAAIIFLRVLSKEDVARHLRVYVRVFYPCTYIYRPSHALKLFVRYSRHRIFLTKNSALGSPCYTGRGGGGMRNPGGIPTMAGPIEEFAFIFSPARPPFPIGLFPAGYLAGPSIGFPPVRVVPPTTSPGSLLGARSSCSTAHLSACNFLEVTSRVFASENGSLSAEPSSIRPIQEPPPFSA